MKGRCNLPVHPIESSPVVLRTPKRKPLLLLAGSLAFVAGGAFLLRTPEANRLTIYVSLASIAFFGLGVLVGVTLLLPNSSYLQLDANGFAWVSLFRPTRIPWKLVDRFHAGHVGANSRVLFDLASGKIKITASVRLAVAMSGHHGALPDTYGLRAKELAELMNKWKDEYEARTLDQNE